MSFSIIRKLDDLYKITLKLNEVLMYVGVAGAMFGIKSQQLVMISIPMYFFTFLGFYSFIVEHLIEAEETIQRSYHTLDWYTASEEVKQLILIAMQQPAEVTFGGIWGADRTSLIRFTQIVRQSYDFGLILLNLANF